MQEGAHHGMTTKVSRLLNPQKLDKTKRCDTGSRERLPLITLLVTPWSKVARPSVVPLVRLVRSGWSGWSGWSSGWSRWSSGWSGGLGDALEVQVRRWMVTFAMCVCILCVFSLLVVIRKHGAIEIDREEFRSILKRPDKSL